MWQNIFVSPVAFGYLERVMKHTFGFQELKLPEYKGNNNVFVCASGGSQFHFVKDKSLVCRRNGCVWPVFYEPVINWTNPQFKKIRYTLSEINLLMPSPKGTLRLVIIPQMRFRTRESMDDEYFQKLRER